MMLKISDERLEHMADNYFYPETEIGSIIAELRTFRKVAGEVFECGLLPDDYETVCAICKKKHQTCEECRSNCPVHKIQNLIKGNK